MSLMFVCTTKMTQKKGGLNSTLFNYFSRTTMIKLLTIALVLISLATVAQTRVGAHLGYGTEVESLAIGVNAEFFVAEKISIAPSFTFFFPKKEDYDILGVTGTFKTSFWEINADGHYYFTDTDATTAFYGLAGLNLLGYKLTTEVDGAGSVSDSDTEFGINLDAGANFTMGNLMPFAEVKFETAGDGQLVLLAGLRFALGN